MLTPRAVGVSSTHVHHPEEVAGRPLPCIFRVMWTWEQRVMILREWVAVASTIRTPCSRQAQIPLLLDRRLRRGV